MTKLDFLEYSHNTPADKKAGTKETWQQRFVVFLVRHDGPVVRINLGPAQLVSEAIDAWRETFGTSPQSAAAGKMLPCLVGNRQDCQSCSARRETSRRKAARSSMSLSGRESRAGTYPTARRLRTAARPRSRSSSPAAQEHLARNQIREGCPGSVAWWPVHRSIGAPRLFRRTGRPNIGSHLRCGG